MSNKYYWADELTSCTTYLLGASTETFNSFDDLFNKVMSLQQGEPKGMESADWHEFARFVVWVAQRAMGYSY